MKWTKWTYIFAIISQSVLASNANTINIFGIENVKNLPQSQQHGAFRLYITSTHNQEYAVELQQRATDISNWPAHIKTFPGKHPLYWIYVGPVPNYSSLLKATHRLEANDLKPQPRSKMTLGTPLNLKIPPIVPTQTEQPHKIYGIRHHTASIQLGFFNTAQQTETQKININTLVGDQYVVLNERKNNIMFGLGVFRNAYEKNGVFLDYGVNAYYLAKTNVYGNVYQEDLFNNLNFQYTVFNVPIYGSLKGEMRSKYDWLSMTMDVGIGPNIAQTSNISEQSIDGDVTIPENLFSATTKTNFSVMAGLGIKINNALGTLPAECGYRFFYLGEGAFYNLNSEVLNTPTTGINYQNALLCSITF